MAVDAGEIVKAVIEFVLADGVIVQNVVHFIANFLTQQTSPDTIDACKLYAEELYEDVDGYVSSGVTVNPMTVHVVVWDGVAGEWITDRLLGWDTPAITFTGTADPLPHQCSAVLVGNTARPKSRGRKFLAPFDDDAAVGPDWGGAVITALGLALNHYLADEQVTVGNDLSPGVPRTDADVFLPFTTGIVNSVVGTQRRRKPGVGI